MLASGSKEVRDDLNPMSLLPPHLSFPLVPLNGMSRHIIAGTLQDLSTCLFLLTLARLWAPKLSFQRTQHCSAPALFLSLRCHFLAWRSFLIAIIFHLTLPGIS